MVDPDIPEAEIREVLARIVSSPAFQRSPQLIDFLEYVVDAKLSGDAARIKAYNIAVDVFGRPTDFDPQSDSSVRVQAGRLRALLTEFNAVHADELTVRINLPRGRYVPEFVLTEQTSEKPATQTGLKQVSGEAKTPTDSLSGTGSLGLIKLLRFLKLDPASVAVFLAGTAVTAVFIVSVLFVSSRLAENSTEEAAQTPIAAQTSMPMLVVDVVSSSANTPDENELLADAPRRLIERLSAFGFLQLQLQNAGAVPPPDAARVYILSGNIRTSPSRVELSLLLTRDETSTVEWSQTFFSNVVRDDLETAIGDVIRRVAAELGSFRGPVHRTALSNLPVSIDEDTSVTAYECELFFELAIGTANPVIAENSKACFRNRIAINPVDFSARLSLAVLNALAATRTALPGDLIRSALYEYAAEARVSMSNLRQNSRNLSKYAMALEFTGSLTEARREYVAALELNPSDSNISALLGRMLALQGERTQAAVHAGLAIDLIADPPPWYYLVDMLRAYRENQYRNALDLALVVSQSDRELGSVIALASAPGAAISSPIEALREAVLEQPGFQIQGVIPRLSVRYRDEDAVQLVRIGLLRAGLTDAILDKPFTLERALEVMR